MLSSSLVIRDANILLVVSILRTALVVEKQWSVLSPAVATVYVKEGVRIGELFSDLISGSGVLCGVVNILW